MQDSQISNLKWQVQKAIKPQRSLSLLLKNAYVNGPQTHFPSASHVLPILVLEQEKLGFFYQFKDNHIYSFDFEGTFVDELLDNGCILEMCKHNALIPDDASSLKTVKDSEAGGEKVKTLTGDLLAHIVYYKIFDAQDEQKIISILEVGYKKKLTENNSLMTEQIQSFIDQFRS